MFRSVQQLVECSPVVLFIRSIQKIQGAADKIGDSCLVQTRLNGGGVS